MKHHWSVWLVVGGLALDLVDVFTTSAGQTGGVLYGQTGILKGVNASLPGHLNTGETLAMVGAAFLVFQGQL